MGIYESDIYNSGGGGGVVEWIEVVEDNTYIKSISGTGGICHAYYNDKLKELIINVRGRNFSFSGNDNTQIVKLGTLINFDGFVMGISWINNSGSQYNAANLGIVSNSTIHGPIVSDTLYATFNTTGYNYSLCFRGRVKLL